MDQELKAKWIAALRSGNYTQARETLRSDDRGYCCLGVLLEVSCLGEWEGSCYRLRNADDEYSPTIESDLGSRREQFGLSREQHNTLVHMNDGDKAWTGNPQSFDAIADYIEKNL
jgi:hypothetical protein